MSELFTTSRIVLIIAATIAITVACFLLVVNFIGGEKKIQKRIERLYSLEEPSFIHELDVLLERSR